MSAQLTNLPQGARVARARACAVEPAPALPADFRMLRIRGVCDLTGLSRAAIYRAVKTDGFPSPVKIGPANSKSSAAAWVDHEVREWLIRKVQASRARA